MRSTTELRQPTRLSGDAALWPGQAEDVKAKRMTKSDEEREKRLAEALRENLRRRKAQARGAEASAGKKDD